VSYRSVSMSQICRYCTMLRVEGALFFRAVAAAACPSSHRHLLPEASKSHRLQPLPLFPALFNAATLEATPHFAAASSNCIVTATSPFLNAKLSSGIGPSTISALLSKVSQHQAGVVRNSKPVTKMREAHVGEGGSVWIDMESRCMLAAPF
jgi:hypothetical protein